MAVDVAWMEQGRCQGAEDMYVPGKAQHQAKVVCNGCQVRIRCLAYALDHGEEFGVWGGKTERERRAMRKCNPEVPSWRRLLEAA